MDEEKRSKRRRLIIVLLFIAGALLILRLCLPLIVLSYTNKRLSQMRGYYGRIKNIDIALVRGAYTIDSIYLNKVDSITRMQTPLFSARQIDLSIEWKALFHGSLVGELVFEKPVITFTREKTEPSTLRDDSTDFKQLLNDFMPLQVNRFEINQGEAHYTDESTQPQVDLKMHNIFVLAQNLRNSYDSSKLLPATINASASLYGGNLTFNMKSNPLEKSAAFDLNAELTNTNLTELNEFFQAYAKVDVNEGTFGMYTEVAARNGKFTGYIKPLIKNLDVLGHEDRKDNLLRKIWEAIAGATAEVFENQKKDQLATKIPFQGKIDNPNTNTWYAVTTILRNAFVQALQPAIDNEISIESVSEPKKKEDKRTLLQKIFGKKKD